MIAAIAASLLGQIGGSPAAAAGAASLFGATQPPAAASAATPHGHASAKHSLSDSVQATLLNLQSDRATPGGVQTDDTGTAAGGLG